MKYGLMTVVAALVFALAGPASALTQSEAQDMVRSVGSEAKVFMVESEQVNAYYAEDMYEGPVIVLMGFNKAPESWQRFIFWHEVGHALQRKSGRYAMLGRRGPYEREWDADAFAIEQLAKEGIDGAELNHDIWAALYNEFGMLGDADEVHGTLVGRITRGNLNKVFTKLQGA